MSNRPTCDSVGDAEESGRPLPRGERLSVVAVSEAHAQQFLPDCLIPQAIDERVAHGTAERQPRHQGLQPLRDAPLSPQGLGAHHTHVRPPAHQEGADHNQDGDEGLALAPCVHQAPPAPVGWHRGARVLAAVPLRSAGVVLTHDDRPAVNLARFHAGDAENDAVAGQHDDEGREDAPGDPEGRVARLPVPGRHARPLEAVELEGGPAEQRRQAAHQGVDPHVGDDHHRTVSCDLHGVDHGVEHGVVPVVTGEGKEWRERRGNTTLLSGEAADTETAQTWVFSEKLHTEQQGERTRHAL